MVQLAKIRMKQFQANISSHQFRYVTVTSINTVNSIMETIREDSHSNREPICCFLFFSFFSSLSRSRSILKRGTSRGQEFSKTCTCNFNVPRDIFRTNFFPPFRKRYTWRTTTWKLFATRLKPADRKMTKTFIPW